MPTTTYIQKILLCTIEPELPLKLNDIAFSALYRNRFCPSYQKRRVFIESYSFIVQRHPDFASLCLSDARKALDLSNRVTIISVWYYRDVQYSSKIYISTLHTIKSSSVQHRKVTFLGFSRKVRFVVNLFNFCSMNQQQDTLTENSLYIPIFSQTQQVTL